MGDSKTGTDSYFTDFRKGEVNELLEQLRAASNDKTGKLKLVDVIKRVIAYMTLGIDVSRLFSQMVMATNTRDMVQKKLVYLYLCNYAQSHPDLTLLAVNTIQKDFSDDSPMVRGLALRSLCSLRLPTVVDYVFNAIQKGLNDQSPYVRKTAVMGCAKLFYLIPSKVRDSGIINKLYEMLRDKDTMVVSNSISALNEILADEGGMAVNKAIIYHLLNRLKDFSEWTTCVILEVVSKYTPSEDETFDILNLLDDRLKHANSAVVFAAAKLFLKFTENLPNIHQQVYERLKTPLLTAAGGAPELATIALQHMQLLIYRSPALFENEYKFFFIKANDPLYLKMLKVQMLKEISTEKNKYDILSELGEYITDLDVELAKSAIKAIGAVGLKIESVHSRVLEQLLDFIELEIDYVTNMTIIVMKDLLRKYPKDAGEVMKKIKKCLKTVDDPNARAAVVWMLGEYGGPIEESAYLLESLVETFTEELPQVRLQLLTSAMKLFFKRPPEMRAILGNLFMLAIADTSNVDVHDRALFYYRLLQTDVGIAKEVIDPPQAILTKFAEDDALEYKDQLFEEFNSLAVVYGKPSDMFIKETPEPVDVVVETTQNGQQEEEVVEEEVEDSGELELIQTPVLDSKSFQAKWTAFPERGVMELDITAPPTASIVDSQMSNHSIRCVASGTVKDTMKFYFYSQDAKTNAYYLVEAIINIKTLLLTAKFKGEDEDATTKYMDYFESVIEKVIP